jgi:hypothetical protein
MIAPHLKTELKKFEPFIDYSNNVRVSVALDWLSVLFNDVEDTIAEPTTDDEIFSLNDIYSLEYTGRGQQHYKYIFNVLRKNEHVATLLSHTRNTKFLKNGVVKIDFKNHILYSSKLWDIYDDLVRLLKLEYRTTSRADIAIDGINFLMDFLNLYLKQTKQSKVVEFVGNAMLRPNTYNRGQCKVESFKLGGSKGKKELTFYNKSLEIVKSRKNYIQEFWLKNKVIYQLLPLEIIAKQAEKEKMYLEGYDNIYRMEFRLKSEVLNQIKGYNINYLQDVNLMMSIVKLHARKFFEPVIFDNERIDRCTRIHIIPYDKFEILNLERIEPKNRTLLYATKQSISKNIKQLYLGVNQADNASLFEMLCFDIEQFDLRDWVKSRLLHWKKEFVAKSKIKDKSYIEDVDKFLTDLMEATNKQEQFELF